MEPRGRDGFVTDWARGQDSDRERVDFLHRTYQHLGGAVIAFILVESLLLQIPGVESVIRLMSGRFSWMVVLGLFMGVSYVAERWARSETSLQTQYLGLGLFIVAEAVLFLPLIFVAVRFSGPDVLPTAALITGVTFGGLTALVLMSKKDFSFLGGILRAGFFVAMGLILASILIGFNLGTLFAGAMAMLAAGSIVYETSNLRLHYRTDQHVAAALGLFASVALLFWYVLRLVMEARR
jgi:hypothetical protein